MTFRMTGFTFLMFLTALMHVTAQDLETEARTSAVLINPIRSITDETTLFYEWKTEAKKFLGLSIGYVRPHLVLDGASFRSFTFHENEGELLRESHGVAARVYRKLFKERKFNSLVFQLRFLSATDYSYVVGEHLSDQAIDVNIDRSTFVLGFQYHKGVVSSLQNRVFHQIQVGLGICTSFSITDYNHYTSIGEFSTEVPAGYRLDWFSIWPTLHLSYQVGCRIKR